MKKLIALLLAFAMVFTLAACSGGGGSSDGGGETSGDVKRLVIADDEWYGTDPYQQDTWSTVQTLINEPIFSIDPDTGALNDSIATGLEVSEDGLTMTFTVPEGKYYASGEQVEPEDIKASLEYGQQISPYAEGWENIESIDVDEATRTVTFHLSRFSSDLLYYLGECFIGCIDKDQLDTMTEDELMWGAQCYAPFYVDSYEPGSFVVLKKNEGFKSDNPYVSNKGPVDIDEIYVKFNTDDFTVIEEMKSGACDYWNAPTPDARQQLASNSNVVIAEKSYPVTDFMEINTDEGIFADQRLREALCLLLNREQYCEKTNGAAVPAYSMIYDTMLYFSQAAKDDFMANYANNETRALELIAEAGWADTDGDGILDKDGQKFEFGMYASTDSTRQAIVQAMQEHLKGYGMIMNAEAIDWNYVHEYLEADDYDTGIHSLEWMEPILILNCMYDDPEYINGGDNDYQWFYDEVTKCAAEPDDDVRSDMLGELQMKNHPEWNCIPLYSDISYVCYSSRVKGINILPNGFIYWNDLSL